MIYSNQSSWQFNEKIYYVKQAEINLFIDGFFSESLIYNGAFETQLTEFHLYVQLDCTAYARERMYRNITLFSNSNAYNW